MSRDTPSKKIEKLIAEGDKHAAKGSFDKALKKYRKAHDIAPDHEGLSDKLIAAHEKALGEHEWSREDFAFHLDLVMRRQEQGNPALKQTHAKLKPEWKNAAELAVSIMGEIDDAKAAVLVERLVSHGEIATRVLIDLIRTLVQKSGNEHGHEDEPKDINQ